MAQVNVKLLPAGIEDILSGDSSATVDQERRDSTGALVIVPITPINASTLKFSATQTIKQAIEAITNGDSIMIGAGAGGIGLVVGNGGLTWTGGTPASDWLSLAQRNLDGTYTWIGHTSSGSNDWAFKGTVSGADGISSTDFVTKQQLDAYKGALTELSISGNVLTYKDENANIVNLTLQSATTDYKGVVELATNAEAIAGTDTTRAVTPASLLEAMTNFSNALPSSGGAYIGKGVVGSLTPWNVTLPFTTTITFGSTTGGNSNVNQWAWWLPAGTVRVTTVGLVLADFEVRIDGVLQPETYIDGTSIDYIVAEGQYISVYNYTNALTDFDLTVEMV